MKGESIYGKEKKKYIDLVLCCVSPEEKKLIRRKMIESKTKNMGAYLRKMAIDGYIVNTVGALWGFRDRKELNENGADLVAEKPTDLVKICEEHGND